MFFLEKIKSFSAVLDSKYFTQKRKYLESDLLKFEINNIKNTTGRI